MAKTWNVYLSGEIHTDWRERIEQGTEQAGLPVEFSAPVTDHPSSDDCGVTILGDEDQGFWKDHKGAKLNAIRTRTLIADADVVVVRFGEKYRQWNAAFDAGYASALGKALVVLHPGRIHPRAERGRWGGPRRGPRAPNRSSRSCAMSSRESWAEQAASGTRVATRCAAKTG